MLPFQFNEDKNKKLTYEYAIKNIMKNYEIHFPTNPLTPRRTLFSPFIEISILFEKRSSKKFHMSVAPMSR